MNDTAGIIRKVRVNEGAPVASDRPRRRPLGLAPGPANDDGPAASETAYGPDFQPVIDLATVDRQILDSAPTTELVYEVLNSAASITDVSHRRLKAKIAALELEHARDQGALAELRSQLHEVSFIVERLRVENKGPPGLKGDRGRDGRDGPRGETGLHGERGEPGRPAPRITGWDVNETEFIATPVMSDGSAGAALVLMGLFASYDRSVNGLDDRDHDAAELEASALLEARAEARRQGRA